MELLYQEKRMLQGVCREMIASHVASLREVNAVAESRYGCAPAQQSMRNSYLLANLKNTRFH